MKELQHILVTVDGSLTNKEGELLCKLARNCNGNGVIVEIGSLKGRSTICMAKGSKSGNNVKIYAIDPHIEGSEHQFRKNIENLKVSDIVIPLVKMSEEAARDFKEPVELCFIDGAHDYESVKLDFDLWYPKLINHGVIAFHDTAVLEGPKRVVRNYVCRSRHFKNCGAVDTIVFAEKVESNSVIDRVRNRYIILLQTIYGLACRLHLPKPIKKCGRAILRVAQ